MHVTMSLQMCIMQALSMWGIDTLLSEYGPFCIDGRVINDSMQN